MDFVFFSDEWKNVKGEILVLVLKWFFFWFYNFFIK